MSAQPDRTVATHRSMRPSRVTRAVGVATAAALLTAGCAAGQVAQTAYQKTSLDGTNASVGSMDLRGVALESPPGQQPFYRPGTAAPMTVVFVNNSRSDDRLTSITTSAASGYAYFTDYNQAHQVEQAAGNAVTGAPTPSASETESSSSPAPSGSAGSSSSGSSSESSSESSSSAESSGSSSPAPSSSSALPTGAQSFTIPAGQRVSIATPDSDAAILLTGISKALYPANVVSVTFTFAKAGSITVPVTVQVATLGRAAEVSGGESDAG